MDTKLFIDLQFAAWLVGIGIPIVVALITKASASSGVKAVVNALLSSAAGYLNVVIQAGSGEVTLKTLVTTIAGTWVVSVATYYGLWRPTGTATVAARTTGDIGIG